MSTKAAYGQVTPTPSELLMLSCPLSFYSPAVGHWRENGWGFEYGAQALACKNLGSHGLQSIPSVRFLLWCSSPQQTRWRQWHDVKAWHKKDKEMQKWLHVLRPSVILVPWLILQVQARGHLGKLVCFQVFQPSLVPSSSFHPGPAVHFF